MAVITKSPEVRPPYEAYARIMGVFAGGLAVAGGVARLLDRDPRDQTWLDLATLSMASFKAARTIARDDVTSFIREPFVEGDPRDVVRIGPVLEVHDRFPRRTNVQVAQVAPDGAIEARVWERGAGETASSGSSAVAIAAAFGRSPATIRFPGGELTVRFEGDRAFLTGPAERVG